MSKQSRTLRGKKVYAEESQDTYHLQDADIRSAHHLKPVAQVTASTPKSETGMIAPANLKSEGHEDDAKRDFPTAVSEAVVSTRNGRKPTVLLVEDTMEIAEVIQAVLNRAEVQTIHESHGAKALTRYSELKPDLILLDIGLPDISGWQVLEGIKKVQGSVLPPVIVITAFGDPANRLVGKFQGVHDYLIKPFTAAEVERVVTKALATRSE